MGSGCLDGTRQLPLAQDLEGENRAGSGDINAVFITVHGDLDQFVAIGEYCAVDPQGLVAQNQGQRARIVDLGMAAALRRGFQRPYGDLTPAQVVDSFLRGGKVSGLDIVEGAESGLVELGMGRMRRIAAGVDARQTGGVGSAEDRADFEGAAQIVED